MHVSQSTNQTLTRSRSSLPREAHEFKESFKQTFDSCHQLIFSMDPGTNYPGPGGCEPRQDGRRRREGQPN
ncbi:hypothetical protein Trydic_g5978 [Trypoxylus dichotomus]